jgi:hypothetical protein
MNLKKHVRYIATRKGRCLRKTWEDITESRQVETRKNPEISNFRSTKETKGKPHWA